MNPLFNNISNSMAQIKNMFNAIKFAQNPQMALSQMIQNNPQIAQIVNMTKGQDLQTVFYNMCKEKGVNPDEILNQLK